MQSVCHDSLSDSFFLLLPAIPALLALFSSNEAVTIIAHDPSRVAAALPFSRFEQGCDRKWPNSGWDRPGRLAGCTALTAAGHSITSTSTASTPAEREKKHMASRQPSTGGRGAAGGGRGRRLGRKAGQTARERARDVHGAASTSWRSWAAACVI